MAQPIKKFVAGNCSVSVFENPIQTKNGATGKSFSVTPQKYYKDKQGQDKFVSSFGINEIPKIRMLLQQSYEFLTLKGKEE